MVHAIRVNQSDFPIRIPVTPLRNSEIEMRFKFLKNVDYKIVRRIQIKKADSFAFCSLNKNLPF